MKLNWLVILIFLYISCKNTGSISIVGNYKSKQYNKIQLFFKSISNNPSPIGSSLIINGDSTYSEINCGNTINGRWWVNKDTLFLFGKSNEFNNDSLRIHGLNGRQPKIGNKPYFGIIKNNNIVFNLELKEYKKPLEHIYIKQ
jgi:hypothetical protein